MAAGGISIDLDAHQVTRFGVELEHVGGAVGAAASRAVRKAANDVERDAKAFCPVDTGNLRSSITNSVTGDGRFSTISAEIGPTADYGIYVEFGTSRMAAQAFLGPAFDRHIGSLESALTAAAVLPL